MAFFSRIVGLTGLALLASLPARAADTVASEPQNGFVRLNFNFAPAAKVSAATQGGVLTLSFDRKPTITPQAIVTLSNGALSSGHIDADGKTLRFALTQPVRLHQSALDARTVIDLAPQSFTGTMPDLTPAPRQAAAPVDPASLPELKLRAGSYSNYTRLVFDWPKPVSYSVFPGAGKIAIRFQALARPDLSAIARFAPPWVKNASWRTEGSSIVVEFDTDSASGFHDFKDGAKVVIDVLAPHTDAAAYAPPGLDKPKVTVLSAAQTKAITDTADKLAGKPAETANPAVKEAEAKPDAKPAEVKTAVVATPPPAPFADSHLIK
ncbi:MAG TPA: hypothetical protein VHM27_11160, partial [Rhizomicrobium sp.]|nr:hypothetical protein [Rhizomicrobium sp.]